MVIIQIPQSSRGMTMRETKLTRYRKTGATASPRVTSDDRAVSSSTVRGNAA